MLWIVRLALRRTYDSGRQPVGSDRSYRGRPSDQSAERPTTTRPALDANVLLAACGGDAGILEKICKAFRAGIPDHLTAIQDALRERDAVRLREAAHKICGMVGAFSTVAGDVASDLQDVAAQGKLEEAKPLAERLESIIQELMQLTSDLSLETLRQ